MSDSVLNCVKETIASHTGAGGVYDCSSASNFPNSLAFDGAVPDGKSVPYTIEFSDPSKPGMEHGWGVWDNTAKTLTVVAGDVLASTSGPGVLVNWTDSADKILSINATAEQLMGAVPWLRGRRQKLPGAVGLFGQSNAVGVHVAGTAMVTNDAVQSWNYLADQSAAAFGIADPNAPIIFVMEFTSGGNTEVVDGQTITGLTSGSEVVVDTVITDSGVWGSGTAAGRFVYEADAVTGSGFEAGELIEVASSGDLATLTAPGVVNVTGMVNGGHGNPGWSFCDQLVNHRGGEAFLINVARVSAPISAFQDGVDLGQVIEDEVNAALAWLNTNKGVNKLDVIIWMQGSADRFAPLDTETYEINFNTMRASAIANGWADADTIWLIPGTDSQIGSGWDGWDRVVQGGDPYISYVNTIGIESSNDGLGHFSGDGSNAVGVRCFGRAQQGLDFGKMPSAVRVSPMYGGITVSGNTTAEAAAMPTSLTAATKVTAWSADIGDERDIEPRFATNDVKSLQAGIVEFKVALSASGTAGKTVKFHLGLWIGIGWLPMSPAMHITFDGNGKAGAAAQFGTYALNSNASFALLYYSTDGATSVTVHDANLLVVGVDYR